METKTLRRVPPRRPDLVLPSVVRVEGYNGEENDEPGSGVRMRASVPAW